MNSIELKGREQITCPGLWVLMKYSKYIKKNFKAPWYNGLV